jgi:KDO2-lipid IV(A) lauroyltransferase
MALTNHFLNIPSIYRWGTKGASYVPASLSYALSRVIADLSYLFYKSAAKHVRRNLSLALPELTEEEISVIAKRLFRNYAEYLVDYGRFTNLNSRQVLGKIIDFEGKDNLDLALGIGKGLILLTAHLGNWELGGIFFGTYGIRSNVVTLPDKDPRIDDIRRWYRDKHGVNTITIGDSPFSMIDMVRALNKQEIIAMLVDRPNELVDCVAVDFFNKSVQFPRGPFILSRITGAPIVAAFVVKGKNGYRGIVEKPLMIKDEKDEGEALKGIVKTLEKYIIMYPDQWYNFVPI